MSRPFHRPGETTHPKDRHPPLTPDSRHNRRATRWSHCDRDQITAELQRNSKRVWYCAKVYSVLLADEVTIDLKSNRFGRTHPDMCHVVPAQQMRAPWLRNAAKYLRDMPGHDRRGQATQRIQSDAALEGAVR